VIRNPAPGCENGATMWELALGVLLFAGTIVAIPIVVAALPADHFADERPPRRPWSRAHPALRVVLLVLKNLAGYALVGAGAAMLVLPGQGLLTILIGLGLIDFPGKRDFERWMVCRRPVGITLNWMRRRAKRPPFVLPDCRPRG